MCIARALAGGLAKLRADEATGGYRSKQKQHVYLTIYIRVTREDYSAQKTVALRYHEVAGVPSDRPCSLLTYKCLKMFLMLVLWYLWPICITR